MAPTLRLGLALGTAALLLVAGCKPKASSVTGSPPGPRDAGLETPVPPVPEGRGVPPSGSPTPPSLPEAERREVVIAPPRSDGWKAEDGDLLALARAMDERMLDLSRAVAETSLYVENEELRGSIRATIQIDSPRRYAIEYQRPDDPTVTGLFVADGRLRAERRGGRWSEPAEVDAAGSLPPAAELASRFADQFPELMFAAFARRRPFWEPLLRQWQQGAGGYVATVEKRPSRVGDREVTFYRIVARTQQGGSRTIEIRVQGERMLPVAIRVLSRLPDGRESKTQWSAAWGFDQPMDEEAFRIPSVAASR